MRTKKILPTGYATAFIGIIAANLTPSAALSENAAAVSHDETAVLSDIVVTARKRDETAQSVPVSINAFSRQQLLDAGVSDARDIAKLTPGLQWKSDNPFGSSNVFLRGVGVVSNQFTSSPAVAIYLDDTYFNSKAYSGFAVFDVDRVEVLKGPQGTLYGRNTTGGAIKYVTRKPKIGEGFNGDLKVDFGNFGLVKAEGGLGADLSNNVAARLSFLSWDRGGIYDNYALGQNTTDIRAKAVRLQIAANPSSELSVNVSASYANSRSDGFRFKRMDTVDPATISFGPGGPSFTGRCANPGIGTAPGCTSFLQFFGAADDHDTDAFDVQSNLPSRQGREHLDTWGVSATVDYEMGFATLTSATSYYALRLTNPQDVDATAANILSIDDLIHDHQFSEELRLTSNHEGSLKWLVGLYYFRDNVDQKKPVDIAALGFGFGNATVQKTDSYSIFGETTYSFTDALDLTLGGRWSGDSRHVDFNYFSFASDPAAPLVSYEDVVRANAFLPGTFSLPNQTKNWSNFSGRVVLSYKFAPDVMGYASFNRGFKAGEFNVGADQAATAKFVEPETLNAYELGLKSDLFEHKLRFNIATFYYDYKNKQETFFNAGVAVLSNADARVKGVELDVVARPFSGLTLGAGYSYLDAKYKDFPNCLPGGISCTGNTLPLAPKGQLSANVRYEVDINGHSLAMQGSTEYSSTRYFDYQNVSYISDKPYWIFNARISYGLSKQLQVAGWIDNIANKRHFTDGFDVSTFGYSLLAPNVPRTFGGSINYRF